MRLRNSNYVVVLKHFPFKKLRVHRKKADSRAWIGKIHKEPGIPSYKRNNEVFKNDGNTAKRYRGQLEGTLTDPSGTI